jgi:O-methyltransferase
MNTVLVDFIQSMLEKTGYKISRVPSFARAPESDVAVCKSVRKYTMTTRARILELIYATRYVTRFHIPGALVECGVWRGGSVMAMLRTLMNAGVTDRDLWLFDTFEGMTPPSAADGNEEIELSKRYERPDGSSNWSRSELDEVKKNVLMCGYPEKRIRFVKGKVEETIPANAPDEIALLRLDTDWYESTKHELEHLYPRLVVGGVLILDDYGAWQGSRQATDEYFDKLGKRFYLHRIDEQGRLLIKQG